MRFVFCFLICFVFSFSALADDFSSDLSWTALVHYQKTMWGGYKATIGSDDFYNAGQIGRTDPKAEMDATIKLFELCSFQMLQLYSKYISAFFIISPFPFNSLFLFAL